MLLNAPSFKQTEGTVGELIHPIHRVTSEENSEEEIATWVNDFQEKHHQIHHYNIVCLPSKRLNGTEHTASPH